MLDKLEALLLNNGYNFVGELGNIPHACCLGVKNKVFDFDKVKDEFFKKLSTRPLKSVDVLFLSKSLNEIYLIEMKSFNSAGTKKLEDFIKDYFKEYQVDNKIIDSILILCGLMGYHDIDKSFYSYFFDNSRLKFKTFLLSDLTDQNLTYLQLSSLDKQKIGLTKRVEGETHIVNCKSIEKILNRS